MAIVGILLVGAVSGATYQAFRPRWVTATTAEIDKVIDPILLKRDPPDPAAEKRYGQLDALLKELKFPSRRTSSTMRNPSQVSIDAAAYRSANHKAIADLKLLLAQGEYRRTDRKFADFEFSARLKGFAKGLELLIDDSSSPLAERLSAVELGETLLERQFQDSHSIIDFLVSLVIEGIIDNSVTNLLATTDLPLRDAKRLLSHLPNIEAESRLDSAIIGEFQTNAYKFLPDPIAYLKGMASEYSDYADFAKAISDPAQPTDQIDPAGNYDAFEAAKLFSDLAVEELRNCDLPSSSVSTPLADQADKVSKSLPKENYGASGGIVLWAKKRIYRMRMASIPNSFAYTIGPVSLLKTLVQSREKLVARVRLLKTQLACGIYADENGHVPATLSDLATKQILQSIPLDPMDGLPLRYNPKRKIIWSIGGNGKDDHGSEKRTPNIPEDIVAHLR